MSWSLERRVLERQWLSILLALLVSLHSLIGHVNGNSQDPPPQENPTTTQPSHGTLTTPTPCADVFPVTSAYKAKFPHETPRVSARLAHECLQTVPNKPEPAKKLVDSLQAFVQWQSTLAWLKNPPSSYMLPATDIVGRLNNIANDSMSGKYTSEYDFQLDIIKTFLSAHDGHFAWRGDVFRAFGFRNDLAMDIVSVSTDGKQIPKLYQASVLANKTNSSSMPPAIVKLNGVNAAELIERMDLEFSSYQDPDSQWNSMFREPSSPLDSLVLGASLAYQGDNVSVTYDNGETRTEDSYAILRDGVDFSGINNGMDFYERFIRPMNESLKNPKPPPNSTGKNDTMPPPPPPQPTIIGYPWPIARDNGSNTTSGYFLNGTGYDDVVVLALSSFSSNATDGDLIGWLNDYQSTISRFLATSKAQNKQKLVLDLTSNGGGLVAAGYELFSQLFPGTEMFMASNLRLSSTLGDMARFLGNVPDNFNATTDAEKLAVKKVQSNDIVGNLVPGNLFSPIGQNLTSTTTVLGPIMLNEDMFTAYQSKPNDMPDPDFNITGVGNKANPPSAAFKPENVVLLTDGTCGSTCTIFSYLMILELNVKTVVVGGRPSKGSMQSIAGVEGTQVFPFNEIRDLANATIELAPHDRRNYLMSGEMGLLAEGYAINRSSSPETGGAVNGKNGFARSNSKIPLQFLMQPANCRFFWTAEMIQNPDAVWKRAVDATWNDPQSNCVDGSLMTLDETAVPPDPLFKPGGNISSNVNPRPVPKSLSTSLMVPGARAFRALLVVALTILVNVGPL